MRLIDADALKDLLVEVLESIRQNPKMTRDEIHIISGCRMLCEMIDDAPTVDAEPVVHARWNRKDEKAVMFDIEWECSKCGCAISTSGIYTPAACGWNYCPNCGAKMDGGAE